MNATVLGWVAVCALEDIQSETGVCALIDGRQIAVFRLRESLYALDNLDPASDANVLSRGILGDVQGELVVASPIYKHHYSLLTGRCLEDATRSVNVYAVRLIAGEVWVQALAAPGQNHASPAPGGRGRAADVTRVSALA